MTSSKACWSSTGSMHAVLSAAGVRAKCVRTTMTPRVTEPRLYVGWRCHGYSWARSIHDDGSEPGGQGLVQGGLVARPGHVSVRSYEKNVWGVLGAGHAVAVASRGEAGWAGEQAAAVSRWHQVWWGEASDEGMGGSGRVVHVGALHHRGEVASGVR